VLAAESAIQPRVLGREPMTARRAVAVNNYVGRAGDPIGADLLRDRPRSG
jgi:hypothetical protein